jgi:guanylate kinase
MIVSFGSKSHFEFSLEHSPEMRPKGYDALMRRGILFVLSGASGVGKGSMLRYVLNLEGAKMHFSVSWTTRSARSGEQDGLDYYFKTRAEFETELHDPNGGGFLEHAEFVGNFYGTPRRAVNEKLEAGIDVMLDVERIGALSVRQLMPEAVLVQVVPPNLSELRQRLLLRGTDDLDAIGRRLKRAVEDIGFAREFDYVIVNNTLMEAVDKLTSIIHAERMRSSRTPQSWLEQAVSKDPDLELRLDRLEAEIRRNGH